MIEPFSTELCLLNFQKSSNYLRFLFIIFAEVPFTEIEFGIQIYLNNTKVKFSVGYDRAIFDRIMCLGLQLFALSVHLFCRGFQGRGIRFHKNSSSALMYFSKYFVSWGVLCCFRFKPIPDFHIYFISKCSNNILNDFRIKPYISKLV